MCKILIFQNSKAFCAFRQSLRMIKYKVTLYRPTIDKASEDAQKRTYRKFLFMVR